jgi:hypothetical protein
MQPLSSNSSKLKLLFLVGPRMEEVPGIIKQAKIIIPNQGLGYIETDNKTKAEITDFISAYSYESEHL